VVPSSRNGGPGASPRPAVGGGEPAGGASVDGELDKELNEPNSPESKILDEEESELVRRAQGGDDTAFGELVRRYQRRIYSLAYGMIGNHADADDLVQEIFIKAYQAIGRFKFRSRFYTWIYRIGVNTILTRRKQWARHRHEELRTELAEPGESPYLSGSLKVDAPDRAYARQELDRTLQAALNSLTGKHRAVVVMHDIEGMKLKEVARVLGISPGTARSRLHYAHRYLREQLKGTLE